MKKIFLLSIVVTLIISFTGCAFINKDKIRPLNSTIPINTPTNSPSTFDDTLSAIKNANVKPVATPNVKSMQITGTFTGKVDSNFIEVTMDDGSYDNYRLSDKLMENFSKLGIGLNKKVNFEYTFDSKTNEKLIISIKLVP